MSRDFGPTMFTLHDVKEMGWLTPADVKELRAHVESLLAEIHTNQYCNEACHRLRHEPFAVLGVRPGGHDSRMSPPVGNEASE